MTWFAHYTFDVGQTDEQARDSFERFVRRMELLNRDETTYEPYTGKDGNTYHTEHPAYVLMGAEDRYRWHGSTTGETDSERTLPPCRCKHCKARGVLTIGH